MLVLKRRVGESIVISGNIEIKLLGVRGESARIGIAAPPQVLVHRQEVYEQSRAPFNAPGDGDEHRPGETLSED